MIYTSLEIIKRTNTPTFAVIKDDVLVDEYVSSEYTGVGMGQYVNIKTGTGATSYLLIPYTVIEYTDEAAGTPTETFSSAFQAVDRLKAVGFFVNSAAEGGGSSTATFKTLPDVNVSNFTGRALQVIRINAGETALESAILYTASRLTDLLDYSGGTLQPNKYLVTTNTTPATVALADIDQVINTPIPNNTYRVEAKGQGNEEPFLKEVGDYCRGVNPADGKDYRLKYLGGDETLISSYKILYFTN